MENIDRAAQLLRSGRAAVIIVKSEAEHLQQHPHERLDRVDDRPEQGDEERDGRRNRQRRPVGISDRDRLRQHLAEHNDQHRHDGGRLQHAALAEFMDEQIGRVSRRGDGDELAAEQHRADEPTFVNGEAVDERGAAVAGRLQRLKPRARGRRSAPSRRRRRRRRRPD